MTTASLAAIARAGCGLFPGIHSKAGSDGSGISGSDKRRAASPEPRQKASQRPASAGLTGHRAGRAGSGDHAPNAQRPLRATPEVQNRLPKATDKVI
jgi:hypothetical protein